VSKEIETEHDLGDEGRASAKEFFMTYFNTNWTGHEGRKRQRSAAREVVRLWQIYPDAYEEVLAHFDLDVEEWRQFKVFIDGQRRASE
jgi:hypothetical protein